MAEGVKANNRGDLDKKKREREKAKNQEHHANSMRDN